MTLSDYDKNQLFPLLDALRSELDAVADMGAKVRRIAPGSGIDFVWAQRGDFYNPTFHDNWLLRLVPEFLTRIGEPERAHAWREGKRISETDCGPSQSSRSSNQSRR